MPTASVADFRAGLRSLPFARKSKRARTTLLLQIALVLFILSAPRLPGQVPGGYTAIPDANFEVALVGAGIDDKIDGLILNANAEKITKLAISKAGAMPPEYYTADVNGTRSLVPLAAVFGTGNFPPIKSIAGIEAFTNLTHLAIEMQQVAFVNLSSLPKLEWLSFWDEPLTAIDLSKNLKLRMLGLSETSLTKVDISMLSELQEIDLNQDSDQPSIPYTTGTGNAVYGFTEIDVTHNLKLQRLYVYGNGLKTIDLSKNKEALSEFWGDDNKFTSMDFSGFTALTYIVLYKNNLTYLNITGVNYGGAPYRLYTEGNPGLKEIIVTDQRVADALEVRRVAGLQGSPTGVFTSPGTVFVASNIAAPTITTQPRAASVTVGTRASFSVVASGTAPLTYQWKKGGVPIAGSTSATYAIGTTATSDAGSYTVTVANSAGSVTSYPAALTVTAAATAPTITTQPSAASVAVGASVGFSVVASGTAPLTYQWKKGGVPIAGSTSATYAIGTTATSDAGSYTVTVANSAGSVTSYPAALTVTAAATAPTITTQPSAASVAVGASVGFSVVASGTAPLTYQWKKDATAISGATAATYTIGESASSDAGSYTVVITNAAGSVTSSAATLSLVSSRLHALSVRSYSGSGGDSLIMGVVVAGNGTKNLIVRGLGPNLSFYGVSGFLADPQLKLYSIAGTLMQSNDDWGGGITLTNAFASVGLAALPAASKDAAFLLNQSPGVFTMHLTSVTGTGISLMELYDSGSDTDLSKLSALSVRGQVGTGANVLIVGFVISGSASKQFIIRGVGPNLAASGVTGYMNDPQLTLFNSSGTQIGTNDDWGGGSTLSNAFASVGLASMPAASKDAAMLVTLSPGVYTVQLSGVNSTTGVGLIEFYEAP